MVTEYQYSGHPGEEMKLADIHQVLYAIGLRMDLGLYYRWDLGYNGIIRWNNEDGLNLKPGVNNITIRSS
jgi:hypothetical protein